MAKPTYITPDVETWVSKFHYFTDIKVRYSETDMSGHVNNVSYMIYFEQARVEYYEYIGALEENMYSVTADITCHYHAEAFFPDALRVGIRVARMGSSSADLEYVVSKTSNNQVVATGIGTVVFMSPETRKPMSIPEKVRARIAETEQWQNQ